MNTGLMKKLGVIAFAMALLLGAVPAWGLTSNEVAKLLASDGTAYDNFGWTVSVYGDTALIGVHYDYGKDGYSGSAYVFTRDGTGNWSQQAKLMPSGGIFNDRIGWSVSVHGDTALIGAQLDFGSGNTGSVYVFTRDGTGNWSQQAKLIPSGAAAFANFGSSVSVYGDTALIGAVSDDGISYHSGSAYVFTRDGAGNWSQQAKLNPSDGILSDRIGWSVSVHGDTALIGAKEDDDKGDRSGSAYVFARDGAIWSEQAKLTASDGAVDDYFGWSVSVYDDTALIGAHSDDDKGSASGSAYVFVRDGAGNWSEQTKLTASDGAGADQFGASVSVYGDTALIGAYGDGSNSGSAYVFTRDGAENWTEQAKLTASDAATSDQFGWSVSVHGNTVLIGVKSDDDKGSNSGSAYVFQLSDPDSDSDGVLDVSDNCPSIPNPDQSNNDDDIQGDACDTDDDNDGIDDGEDNCPLVANADQFDTDGDETGDMCDDDLDGDTVLNEVDNCPANPNVDQTDTDFDAEGDECDVNDDNDAFPDINDNCPTVANNDQADLDSDGIGDICDIDIDGDGVENDSDNCPVNANYSQDDTDYDGLGDACDADDDNDGIDDGEDNCALIANPSQEDTDGDSRGDVCDDDLDGDGVDNGIDNCPIVANSSQNDFDGDGHGDACDPDIDEDGVANGGDLCAETPFGEIVDPSTGCSIDELCPCAGPRGTNVSWRNHGKYISCVAKSSESFVELELITEAEKDAIVSSAAQSSCGDKK